MPSREARITGVVGLLEELAAATIGATFNQYRETGGDDLGPEAPAIRLANLRQYLTARVCAPVVLVGEAAGWRGARYSGLCLCSERQLISGFAGIGHYRCSSRHPRGWSEPSATVVQGVLRQEGWSDQVLLVNVVPTHPAGAEPHTNRRPSGAEIALGAAHLRRLLDIIAPRHLAAIGRIAGAVAGDVPMVRHPAHGGALLCREQLGTLLGGWL
ncbi:MAG: uracil-DNA glycosylase [Candidatus Dormiibacterota bacterium]